MNDYADIIHPAHRLRFGLFVIVDPDLSPARVAEVKALTKGWRNEEGDFVLATGGTGGSLRLARLRKEGVRAAVNGFTRHFGIQKVNTIELLPRHHVSGFMSRCRALLTDGDWIEASWKDWSAGRLPDRSVVEGRVCSMVPTQLARLLSLPNTEDWLRAFGLILLGGGPAWPTLIDRAREARLRLCPCYGMTETCAMVTAMRPDEFLDGSGRGVGRPLPHATVSIEPASGRIVVEGESLFAGYVGEPDREGPWLTGDLGEISDDGQLTVLGRADDVLITGGLKVSVAWLEARLHDLLPGKSFAVVGVADARWGQRLVLATDREIDADLWREALGRLEPHQRPKNVIVVPEAFSGIPGKINRKLIVQRASADVQAE